VVLQPGKYTAAQLQNMGIPTINSLRVPKGCNVKQYASANLQGDATSFSKNKPLVKTAATTSVKVACMSMGTPFSIAASDEIGQKGDLITVDVNVSDFNKVVSMQYSMNWDPKILQYEKVQNFKLKALNLNSGTVLYQVVFRVIGTNTNKSRIRFSGKPLIIEVMKADGTPLPFNNTNGSFVSQEAAQK